MADVKLLDQYGKQIDRTILNEEIAAPSIFGIRQIWKDAVSPGLDPAGLAAILQGAIDGDARAYLHLAEEMEERDLHYRSVLNTRKNAIKGIEPIVTPFSKDAADLKIAEEIEAIVTAKAFRRAVGDFMDALGKGYSVTEIVWDTTGSKWVPTNYKWRQPYHFVLDKETEERLQLITAEAPVDGEPLAYGKFVTHLPALKSGVPIRGGIAFVAAWGYLFKSFSAKDWIAFAEVFGMPIRLGKYGRDATNDEIGTLVRAIRNIGTDAGAVIPNNMMIEFESAVEGAGGDKLYEKICNYWDAQLSKVVLGQTMTTDNGSSLSQAQVHDEIRIDIKEADASDLESTVQRDVVETYLLLNYGRESLARAPQVCFPVPRPVDMTNLVGAVEKLVPLGLKVSLKSMYEKIGLEPPDDDDDLLQATAGNSAGPLAAALNFAQTGKYGEQFNEDLVDESLKDWQEIRDPVLVPILKALNDAKTPEQFAASLERLAGEIDSSALANRLGKLLFQGRVTGRAG